MLAITTGSMLVCKKLRGLPDRVWQFPMRSQVCKGKISSVSGIQLVYIVSTAMLEPKDTNNDKKMDLIQAAKYAMGNVYPVQ